MAAAPTTAASGWPRRRLLLALLVVSLMLNLFFVAGAVWSRLHGPGGLPNREHRHEQIAAELDLDAQQRIGFDKYVAAMRSRNERMRREIAPLIAGAWQEIARPQADIGQIMQRYDDASRKWREFQRESAAQTLDFLATLSPAQRAKFIALEQERRAARLRRSAQRH